MKENVTSLPIKTRKKTEKVWLRRQAVQIVAQLPEDSAEAMEVLKLAEVFVTDFISSPA